ncbi:MAG TPA: transporter substrate-binding domain-containing protein [Pseudolysinimonas sp.]|nr:transporter substrate-binding domain-containing protein [Pseudolysinimonas sp.]
MKRNRLAAVLLVPAAMVAMLAACSDPTAAPPTDEECVPAHDITTIEEGYLTVAHFPNPPFADSEGDALTGAEGEILTRIAEMECLQIKIVPGNVAAMIPSVESGRADTTLGSWYRTEERSKIVLLSDPVITVQLAIASMKGSGIEQVQDLKGHLVGSTIGSLWVDDVQALIGDDQKLYETLEASYADLAAGRIEAIINSEPTAIRQIQLAGLEDQVEVHIPAPDDAVAATAAPGQTNFPVSKDNPGLQSAINDNLATLREAGEVGDIFEKYGISRSSDVAEPYSTF